MQYGLFLIVGVLNTAFGYSIFSLLVYCKWHYTLAALGSSVAGVVFNYFTTGRIVFKNKDFSQFFRFGLVYVGLYVLNVLLLRVLQITVSDNLYISGLISAAGLSLVSFAVNKQWVFNTILARD